MRVLLAVCLSLIIVPAASQDDPHANHPRSCDNNFENAHACACEHADTKCDPNDPDDKRRHEYMTDKCQTYCKPKHCHCASPCNT
jgi:hypothetical protein